MTHTQTRARETSYLLWPTIVALATGVDSHAVVRLSPHFECGNCARSATALFPRVLACALRKPPHEIWTVARVLYANGFSPFFALFQFGRRWYFGGEAAAITAHVTGAHAALFISRQWRECDVQRTEYFGYAANAPNRRLNE